MPQNDPSPNILPFDDRARRVLELQELIRRGEYRPDPREIARALLDHWHAVPDFDVPPSASSFDPARYLVRPQPVSAGDGAVRAAS